MKIITRFLLIVVVILAAGTSATAGVLAHQTKNILLGVWQMPPSGGLGAFLSSDLFTPGRTLAVKIFLERPGEDVNVTLNIEIPGKSKMTVTKTVMTVTKTVKDNGSDDLWPEPKVVIMELIMVPKEPIAQYMVEVTDQTGPKPLVKVMTNPAKPAGLLNRFGQAVAKTADSLWRLPDVIAETIFIRHREVAPPPLSRLVLADFIVGTQNTQIIPQGSVSSPVWLPNQRILFVHTLGKVSYLRVTAVTLTGAPQDFGGKPTLGTEPHFARHGQRIFFRQGTKLFSANLAGTKIRRFLQDKAVAEILGVLPDANSKTDNLIFTVVNQPGQQWIAKMRGTKVLSAKRLPADPRWALLAQVQMYGERILYARHDTKSWKIYLSQTLSAEGKQITEDVFNSRDPAWSPDGNQIVYVQGDANATAK